MTYLVDGAILTGIAIGYTLAILTGAVVIARMGIAFRDWTRRNAR